MLCSASGQAVPWQPQQHHTGGRGQIQHRSTLGFLLSLTLTLAIALDLALALDLLLALTLALTLTLNLTLPLALIVD